jgi:hypothetical protein
MKTLLQRLRLKEPEVNDMIVHQVVREWLSAYKRDHLKGLGREVLEKEQDWCN